MKPVSLDTSSDVQRIHHALLRAAPAGKKLILTFELIQMLRCLTLADVRRQFPNVSEEELRRRFIARLLPREDVIKAYGFDPLNEQS
jgi:hypothetical protein